jgi:hypothetical protein
MTEKEDQGQCCKGHVDKMDVREQTSGETGRHHWNKELRLKTAATSEEGDDKRQRHQRTKQETGATSGKREDIVRGKRQTLELEITKQIVGTSIRLRKMNVRTLWRGQPPPKEEVGAINVGALTSLGTFAPTDRKSRMMVINLHRLAPYEGTARDERP